MRNKILEALVLAMKKQDKETLSVLRMVKGAMQLEEIKIGKELDDASMVALIAKEIKTRKESITEFEKGNRHDLIEKVQKEIAILNIYMPELMSEVEITKNVMDAIEKVNASSLKDMGKVMGMLTPILKGKADMALVNKIVKEKLI